MPNTGYAGSKRLDQYVVGHHPELSRSLAAKLIDDGNVLVNGKTSKPGYKLRDIDTVTINYDRAKLEHAAAIELPILYEDTDCVVVNKPAGILTHSKGSFNPETTVATWLQTRWQGTATNDRDGIVHRLDRDTSGLLICAKNPEALSWLQKQFASRKAKKRYFAVVSGKLPHDHAIIDMPIMRNPKQPQTFRVGANGKPAITEYWVNHVSHDMTLLELQPQTGRTHQLRVHLSQIGHPIVGDRLYGGKPADRLYLHATELELTLPCRIRKTFTSQLPNELQAMIQS